MKEALRSTSRDCPYFRGRLMNPAEIALQRVQKRQPYEMTRSHPPVLCSHCGDFRGWKRSFGGWRCNNCGEHQKDF